MKEIKTINEVHSILLNIAKAFSEICERHHIPYFMIGGTMLGAVRHKGFIPWDDDMDFGVYSEDYERLQDCLIKELKKPYRCITFENCKYIKYPFFKIEDQSTCIMDNTVDLPLEEMPGLNIDIFPIYPCKKDSFKCTCIFGLMKLDSLLFLESSNISKINNSLRTVLRFIFPRIRKETLLRKILKLAKSMKGDCRGNIFGRWKQKETFSSDYYTQLNLYAFDSFKFYGIKNYDYYLRQMYGDYMLLPPKDKRLVHIDKIYFK